MPSGKANQHSLTTLGAEDKEAASANRRVEPCGMESSGTEPCEWLHPPGARHQGQACHQDADAPPGVRLLLLRSPSGTTLREALDAQKAEFLEQCCADHGMRTLDANLEAVTPQAIQNNILPLPPRARWRIVIRGTRIDGRQLETFRKGILLIILLRRMHRLVIARDRAKEALGADPSLSDVEADPGTWPKWPGRRRCSAKEGKFAKVGAMEGKFAKEGKVAKVGKVEEVAMEGKRRTKIVEAHSISSMHPLSTDKTLPASCMEKAKRCPTGNEVDLFLTGVSLVRSSSSMKVPLTTKPCDVKSLAWLNTTACFLVQEPSDVEAFPT
eukprot:CAMPEP_0203924978 /NCGR_PEP_ID=MMETSP0359-20131031/64687_1 /ASSEMBLY_ACC=CAM_ASM_000338 /TAXON_ID=268821 /ORGANISM="Scrippsiella Hangoei, Strain SHTV-5" /LENGTH=326 /DNA_ID=CAMNT_0050853309 /DNA_START=508 /DNA_END=1489 /DNA_ORIENTATION=+